jgi:TonB family protein
LIAYATAPGSIASDGGAGRNGIYTRELLKVISVPDLSIEDVFKRVRISVHGLTQGKQTPWESSSLMGNFSFRQSVAAVNNVSPAAAQPSSTTTPDPVLTPNDSRVPLVDYERVFTLREVDQKPNITAKPQPSYTESGRQNQIQGGVRLQAILDRSGSIREIRVLSGAELGHGLPEQAIAAARKITFTPAVKDGRPVSVQVTLQYYFSLY